MIGIWKFITGNWKGVILALVLVYGYQLYTQNVRLKQDKEIADKNESSAAKADSVGYQEIELTKPQIIERVTYDPVLMEKLDILSIRVKDIQSVMTTYSEYMAQDTTAYVLTELMKGIKESKPTKEVIKSKDSCYSLSGILHYNGRDIVLDSIQVAFKNRTDIIAHLEKRKFTLKFWKYFKRRRASITVENKCGKSKTVMLRLRKER